MSYCDICKHLCTDLVDWRCLVATCFRNVCSKTSCLEKTKQLCLQHRGLQCHVCHRAESQLQDCDECKKTTCAHCMACVFHDVCITCLVPCPCLECTIKLDDLATETVNCQHCKRTTCFACNKPICEDAVRWTDLLNNEFHVACETKMRRRLQKKSTKKKKCAIKTLRYLCAEALNREAIRELFT